MHIFKLSVFALSLSAVVGCKAIEAMDNTGTMKQDLAAMKSTTGGMATTTESMERTTLELKRKASIGEGLKLIDAPENQREFAPPSKGLLAGAKLVAENMSSEELVKFFQAGLKGIRNTAANEQLEGNPRLLGGYPSRYILEFNRRKEVEIVTMQAIAAMIPQPMIDKIVQEQLQGGGGAESDEAKDLLMLRGMFINNFFFSESIFATGKKIDNMGKLRNAMKYARQLQFLVELAHGLGQRDRDQVMKEINAIENPEEREAKLLEELKKEPIKFLNGDKFLQPVFAAKKLMGEEGCVTSEEQKTNPDCQSSLGQAPNYNDMFALNVAKFWFNKIAKRIDKDMPEDMRGGSSPYAREIAEIKEECLRYAGQN